METKWTIYKITFPNGKNYIGLTINLKRRIMAHRRDAKKKTHRPVYNAINHFGWDNIKFEEVHTEIPSLEEANSLEKKYIVDYNSHISNKQGYNCTEGGDGCMGVTPSKKLIEALKLRNIESWKNEDYRNRMIDLFKSRKGNYSDESKQKMSKSAKARIARDGHHWTGRTHSKETKEKMSGLRPNAKYSLASYYRGKRIYCPELQVVFFSARHCADFLNIKVTTLHYRIKHKTSTLSEYKDL